jgi:hypothetical protein
MANIELSIAARKRFVFLDANGVEVPQGMPFVSMRVEGCELVKNGTYAAKPVPIKNIYEPEFLVARGCGAEQGPPWDDEDPVTAGQRRSMEEQRATLDAMRANPHWADLDRAPRQGEPLKYFRECAAINAYLARVNGIWKTLNTAVIETDDTDEAGYRGVHVTLKFLATGRVTITPKSEAARFAPSDEEKEAIRAEAHNCRLVQSMTLPVDLNTHPATPWQVKKAAAEGRLFAFYDCPNTREGGRCMLQERVEATDNRPKLLIPWTYWGQSEWLRCAPEGPLPFWGMDRLLSAPEGVTVCLHEGAKCARFAATLNRQILQHPWQEALCDNMVHLGWISGARYPEGSDWSGLNRVLRDKKVAKIIVFLDNDAPGRAALSKIAQALKVATFACNFPADWAPGCDIADAFPESLFKTDDKGGRRYRGPSFTDCLTVATWATDWRAQRQTVEPEAPPADTEGESAETQPAGGRPAVTRTVRPWFAAQWFYIKATGQFVNKLVPTLAYKKEPFDDVTKPFRHPGDYSLAALMLADWTLQCESFAYRPGQGEIVQIPNQRLYNRWRGTSFKPLKGDIQPFVDFVTYLFPIEAERNEVLRWIATIIACPERRLKYHLLLISETQGVGKDTLALIVRLLVGLHNCSNPSATHIVTSTFCEWWLNNSLAVVSEIYEGHSWRAYNTLKTMMTETTHHANPKGVPSYDADLHLHLILLSNSLRCLKIENTDRRLLIPLVAEDPWSEARFQQLYDWLLEQDGLRIVLHWAQHFEENGLVYVSEGAISPETARKTEIIEASLSPAEQMARELMDGFATADHPLTMCVTLLWGALREQLQELPKEQLPFVRNSITRRLHQNKNLYLTANKDRLKIPKGGGLREVHILNAQAVLEVQVLFDVVLDGQQWRRASDGADVRVGDVLRWEKPHTIAGYIHAEQRRYVQHIDQITPGPAQEMPIGPWPKYSGAFLEARLKQGKC